MHTFWSRTACLALPLLIAVSTPLASAQTVRAEGQYLAKLRQGDLDSAVHIAEAGHFDPMFTQLAKAQVNYNISTLAKLARQCLHEKIKSALETGADKDDPKWGVAWYCNYILMGSDEIIGNDRVYFSDLAWDKNVLYPELREHAHKTVKAKGILSLNLKDWAAHTPATVERWQSAQQVMKIDKTYSTVWPSPVIRIAVNGHVAHAMIDDGLKGPPFPLVIFEGVSRPGVAQKFGLKLVDALPGSSSGGTSTGKVKSPGGAYLADTVKIGPLVLKHFAVAVRRTNSTPPGIYIRSSLLRRFGEVTISENRVILSRQSQHDCNPAVRMAYAAGATLEGSMVFPATLNGRPVMANMDTEGAAPIAEAAAGSASTSSGSRLSSGPATLIVGSATIHAGHPAKFPAGDQPYQVEIGTGVLKNHPIHLVFDGPYPTVCISSDAAPPDAGQP